MVDPSNAPAEICIIGRTQFYSGIGAVSFAACELLSRHFPISIFPTDIDPKSAKTVILPNKRIIPICHNLSAQKVFFYTDVLWNGAHDLNYTRVPHHGFRIAHIAYDSDELPPQWVKIINNYFDLALFSSRHLETVAKTSDVTTITGTLPIGLALEKLLPKSPRDINLKKIRFGSVAAFHKRKNIHLLINAFLDEFGNNPHVELVLHSNLAIGDSYHELAQLITNRSAKNVILAHQNLDETSKLTFLDSIDIFVNCSVGEGYSIGPREALALGKALVLSDIGPHQDMMGLPGVFFIPTSFSLPARYPEIDNQIFGKQHSPYIADIRNNLVKAFTFVKTPEYISTVKYRKERAAEFSFTRLSMSYAEILNPVIRNFKKDPKASIFTHIPETAKKMAIEKLGNQLSKLNIQNRTIVPAHDGGFFSVFNVFMSHLVWDSLEDNCHLVLPDWDVGRILQRNGSNKMVSFCYGTPQDGNIWLKLFEPLYGLSHEEMNDEKLLYKNFKLPKDLINASREPLLTYIHAYDLYKSPSFANFRKQYHRLFKHHIRLLPALQLEIDTFFKQHFSNKWMIAAHVKHPSHAIEQPNMLIAHCDSFIHQLYSQLQQAGIDKNSSEWGIFLATDQERVVQQFTAEFGDRVCFFADVRRTSLIEDERYDKLPSQEKIKEGYQVQHLVAASPESWSTQMAWEVIRDAMLMAKCEILLHVVSNVSTAVSYFNPDIKLVFVR